MDDFVRFLLPVVVLLMAALVYEVVRGAQGRRLTLFDASLIAVLLVGIFAIGGWAVAEWLPRSTMVPVAQEPAGPTRDGRESKGRTVIVTETPR